MICPGCSAEHSDTFRFCPECGTPLGTRPEMPGDRSAPFERLIPKAYADHLAAADGRVQSERRVVTILFLDMVGSTTMAEHLDPEDVVDIANASFEAFVEPVHRHGGTVARFMGDALLAFFGAPRAHEDDPARACRAALAMLDAARRLTSEIRAKFGTDGFAVRIGINTGLVVVGEVGSSDRVEYTAMGDAVNLASRIEHMAEPGTVLIGEGTERLVRHAFDLEDRGPIQVRGRSGEVRLFRLLRERDLPALHDPVELQAPMIGRDRHLAHLQESFGRLSGRLGGIVTITGDPGIGKTRLLLEARKAMGADVRWVETRFVPTSEGVASRPAAEVLFAILELDRRADPAKAGEVLYRALEEITNGSSGVEGDAASAMYRSPADFYPYLARIIDAPCDAAVEKALGDLNPETLRRQAAGAFVEYMRRVAQRRPLALVIEDLHWADGPMLELLEVLMPVAGTSPLLLVFSLRREQGPAWQMHQRCRSELRELYLTIDLEPLDREDAAHLARSLWKTSDLPDELLSEVIERAEGNAFFLEEVLKSILESGGRAGAPSPGTMGHIPTTVQGVIISRIDALPHQHKQVLQTAAVIGRVFPKSVLQSVLEDELNSDALGMALDNLCRRDLLHKSSLGDGFTTGTSASASAANGSFYRFKHALTAETTYHSLLRVQRRELHARVARAIEAIYDPPPIELSESLAHHCEIGGLLDLALHYLSIAADRAARLYSHQKAIGLYQRALRLAKLGEIREDRAKQAASIHERLGDIYFRMSDYAAASEGFGAALDLVKERLRRATLLRKQGQVSEKWGRHDDARRQFEGALEVMGRDLDFAEAAHVYSGLCLVHYHLEDFEPAEQLGELALTMMKSLGDVRGEAQALNNLGIVFNRSGEPERAQRYLHKSLLAWQEANDCYGLAMCHNNLGLAARDRGDRETALSHFQTSLELFGRLGNSHGAARVYDNMSQIYADAGELETATEFTMKAVAILAEIGMDQEGPVPEMWQSGTW